MNEYRGEVRPRRQPTRHKFTMSASTHRDKNVNDPFPPISSAQFPALYVRSLTRNAYRSYMRSKSIYQAHKGM